VDGQRYLDFAAGFGSAVLGHSHPRLLAALHDQATKLLQGLGDVYASDVKVALLEQLARLHPDPNARVLLTQSGGDAVTAALKTALLATGKPGVIAFDGGYHGLGYAPLAACGYKSSFRTPFTAHIGEHVRFAPYPGVRGASADASLSIVEQALRNQEIGAVLVEPVMGRGGCIVPPDGFLAALKQLTSHRSALLVADEIWTGFGRSGALVRSVADGVSPDILCFGKGLGGGYPVSACVARGEVMEAWAGRDVIHTSTHAGAPLACAAALATLDVITSEGLVERSARIGAAGLEILRTGLSDSPVTDIRGAGLMLGIELEDAASAQSCIQGLLDDGFVVIGGGVRGDTLTLTPPLTVELDAIGKLADALRQRLEDL